MLITIISMMQKICNIWRIWLCIIIGNSIRYIYRKGSIRWIHMMMLIMLIDSSTRGIWDAISIYHWPIQTSVRTTATTRSRWIWEYWTRTWNIRRIPKEERFVWLLWTRMEVFWCLGGLIIWGSFLGHGSCRVDILNPVRPWNRVLFEKYMKKPEFKSRKTRLKAARIRNQTKLNAISARHPAQLSHISFLKAFRWKLLTANRLIMAIW